MTVVAPPKSHGPSAANFAAVSFIMGVCFALIVLALHFLPTGYDPARQVISDYAVGTYGSIMDLSFVAAGVGGVALAFALLRISNSIRFYRAGVILLFVAGLATLALAAFSIDLQGAIVTTHGEIHSLATLIVFILQPVGILLVSRVFGRIVFALSLIALIAAAVVFLVVGAFSMNTMGLSERVFVGAISSWPLVVSIRIYTRAS